MSRMTIERERQTEAFQFRLQTKTILLDDEINRLNDFLLSLQAEIVDAKDQYQHLSVTYDQKQQAYIGKETRSIISKEELVSRIKSSHYLALSKMGEEQTKQIQIIHDDVENYFSQVEGWMNEKLEQRLKPINTKIEHTRARIEKIKKASQTKQNENTEIEDVQSLTLSIKTEEDLIRRLEESYKEKSNEKLESLQVCQQQLSDCLNILDEMKRTFQSKVEDYQRQLLNIDTKQKEKIAKETDKQKKELTQLELKLKETTKRAADIQRATNASTSNMREKLNIIINDNMSLRSAALPPVKNSTVTTSIDAVNQLNEENERLLYLMKKREKDENRLTDARTKNESLKREIARIKHEIRVRRHRESFQ